MFVGWEVACHPQGNAFAHLASQTSAFYGMVIGHCSTGSLNNQMPSIADACSLFVVAVGLIFICGIS